MADEVSVGDVLGAAGSPAEVVWGGKTYKVGPPTDGAISRVEMLVAAQAGAEVDALKGVLPDSQHRELADDLKRKLMARSHRAGGDLFTETLQSPDGQVLYLLALLREYHPEMTERDARRMTADVPDQVERALILVTPDFLMLVAEMKGADPRRVQAILDQLNRSTGSSPGSPASPDAPRS
jgi:hypothetical protein